MSETSARRRERRATLSTAVVASAIACARSIEPHGGVKPDPAASAYVDMEEHGVREAPYSGQESGTFDEETLDVGAVDVGESKVERPSLGVALGVGAPHGVRVAVDDVDGSPGERLGELGEEVHELGGG